MIWYDLSSIVSFEVTHQETCVATSYSRGPEWGLEMLHVLKRCEQSRPFVLPRVAIVTGFSLNALHKQRITFVSIAIETTTAQT